MTKTEAIAPQPKEEPKRKASAPARWQKEATPERVAVPDGEDRWAHMPCTD
ncbi:MAG: hypothetical protein ACLQBL_18280 [Polyangiaceae bacterium]|jgi:hypothetical protein